MWHQLRLAPQGGRPRQEYVASPWLGHSEEVWIGVGCREGLTEDQVFSSPVEDLCLSAVVGNERPYSLDLEPP